jgi:hypothetical protein
MKKVCSENKGFITSTPEFKACWSIDVEGPFHSEANEWRAADNR